MKVSKDDNFFKDGKEIVKLINVVDGDTAIFSLKDGKYAMRFYGINAPESTKRIDPYGLEATKFATLSLTSAKYIVIEADDLLPELDSTGSRYLCYVWYGDSIDDLVLFQEDILQCGLAKKLIMDNVTKYNDRLIDASYYARSARIGIYSPKTKEEIKKEEVIKDLTINDLLCTNKCECGDYVKVTGTISGKISDSFFLEDRFSIYVYNVKEEYSCFNVGTKVRIVAQYSFDSQYGVQLVNIKSIEKVGKKVPKIEKVTHNFMEHISEVIKVKYIHDYTTGNKNQYNLHGYIGNEKVSIKVSRNIKPEFNKQYFKSKSTYELMLGILNHRTSFYAEFDYIMLLLNDYDKSKVEINEDINSKQK